MSYNYKYDKLAMGGSRKFKKGSFFNKRRIGGYLSALPVIGSVVGGAYRGIRGYTSSKKGGWSGIKKGLDKMAGYSRRGKKKKYPGISILRYKSSMGRFKSSPYTPMSRSLSIGVMSNKFLDANVTTQCTEGKIRYLGTPASTTDYTRTINLIRTSFNSINDRIGPRIYLQDFRFSGEIDFQKWTIATPPVTDGYPTGVAHVRMIIFVDKFSDNTEVSPDDLLADNSSATASCLSDYNNLYNKNRFVILKDKLFTYTDINKTTQGVQKFALKLKLGFWAEYAGVLSTDWTTNSVKVMIFQDVSSSRDLYYIYNSRLTYYG